MAAYKKGEITSPCQIVKPKIGIITGINQQHLSTFGTMENLLSAEGGEELIESLPEDGIVFLNGKNSYCRELYQKTKIKKFLYGENAPLLMENLAGAKLVAKELGMSEEEIEKACQGVKNSLPGIEVKKGINGITVIDASYSANPDGVISHLDYLKAWPGKKVIVMPCLIELGKASKEIHQEIGRKIGEVCHLCIVTTRERFQEIRQGATEKGMKDKDILFSDKPKEIFEIIKGFCQPGDVVILESRVPNRLISLLGIREENV
jgi:UDP-N-acetylmuramoyl-tripeptide--D-alanyl-D-alanine ligase